MMTLDHAALIMKALSEPNRLRIVSMASGGEQSATALLKKLSISQPTMSHHMKLLCECGMLTARRQGVSVMYAVNEQTRDEFLAFLGIITGAARPGGA